MLGKFDIDVMSFWTSLMRIWTEAFTVLRASFTIKSASCWSLVHVLWDDLMRFWPGVMRCGTSAWWRGWRSASMLSSDRSDALLTMGDALRDFTTQTDFIKIGWVSTPNQDFGILAGWGPWPRAFRLAFRFALLLAIAVLGFFCVWEKKLLNIGEPKICWTMVNPKFGFTNVQQNLLNYREPKILGSR